LTGITNTTKTATGLVMNTSWTLILVTAQLDGNNLTQTKIAARFGTRLVVTSGIVYLVEYIGIGDYIMYLQYLSYVYNGVAMLSGVPSMLGSKSKKLIGSRNLSELKLLKGVSEYFSKFLTSQNVIDNFDSLSEERQLDLMNQFINGTEYNNLVTKLPDAPAQSIIESSVDNVNVFADRVDAGKWIIRINYLSQGAIVYTFVSLIDNILERRGTYRQISSYFATPESVERAVIKGSVVPLGFTNKEIIGEGTDLPPPETDGIRAAEATEEAAPTPAQNQINQGTILAATTDGVCPNLIGIKRLITGQHKRISGQANQATYNVILKAALGDAKTSTDCTYGDIKADYIALKKKVDDVDVDANFTVNKANIDGVAEEIDKMLEKLYNKETEDGPLHHLANRFQNQNSLLGGKKKKGSKKNKVEKKKGRKTKRKMYTKKKKGNSKKHKKKSKVKRNTRRK